MSVPPGGALAGAWSDFDPHADVATARTPPALWYLDPHWLALEREHVLLPRWQWLTGSAALSEPGCYFAAEPLGEPLVAVRGDDGRLRAFRNVCLHHAAEIAHGSGRVRRLLCPYHGWSYELDGRLASAPRCPEGPGFETDEARLAEVPVEVCGPLVFAAAGDMRPAGPPLPPALQTELAGRGWQTLRFVERRVYELRCNWKVYVDNYLDGGYHVAALHRGLAAELRAETYVREVHEDWVLQRVTARSSETSSARVAGEALYAWVHPNLMLNRYGPFLDVNYVEPVAADRTRVVFEWYVTPEIGDDADFLRESLASSETVQREDEQICESVQRGIASRGFRRGVYAPDVEDGLLHFHRLLHRDLSGALMAT